MQELRDLLKTAIKTTFGLDFEPEVVPSPENIDADFSSNAPLKLAKELHKPPMEIAETLRKSTFEEHIRRRGEYGATGRPLGRVSERSEASSRNDEPEGAFRESAFLSVTPPGFINFTLSDEYLASKIADFNENFDKNISWNEYSDKTAICEFSDPNPFKVLHVGHLYTSFIGDSISRLYEYAGAKVIRANFGGDVGLHVAKTMYILEQKPLENLTIEDIARCYVEGTAAYDDDENAKAEITKLNKEIYKINAENIHGTKISDLYWRGRELSYDYFKDFYAKIGLKFNKFYPESTVANLGLETVKRELENGVYELSDGAVIFNGDKFGLHTRVFINREGVPTYEAKDVGLIFQKWDDWHFDKSVIITGNEQLEYMKVVLKSIEQYAPELVEKTAHLTHGLVKLAGGVKMSSRKGNFLKAVDVLDMVNTALEEAYNSTDSRIALAAAKYAFLKYKMGGDIIFDPRESVKMTGNSGPYLLYSCVRAKKVLTKPADALSRSIFADGANMERPAAPWDALASEAKRRPVTTGAKERSEKVSLAGSEKDLIKKIIQYPEMLKEAVREMAPHKVASFLYELAQEFSRFYENCPINGTPEEAFRRELTKVYLDVMTHGLNILGITDLPEKM